MSPLFLALLAGFGLSASLIVAIGAQNLFVLRQGLQRRHVGPIVLFCSAADALLILLGTAGASVMLAAIPGLALVLSIGGALFLAWYGLTALRRMARGETLDVTGTAPVSLHKALIATAGFTFLNPHVYLDTVVLMGAAASARPADLRPAFAIGAISASFCWFTAIGYGARLLRPIFARPQAWRILDAMIGLTMLSLAASLLRHALTAAG